MLIEINDLYIVEYIRSLINNVQYFVAYVLNVSRIHPPPLILTPILFVGFDILTVEK